MQENPPVSRSRLLKPLTSEIRKFYWWNLVKQLWSEMRRRPDREYQTVAESLGAQNTETKVALIRYSAGRIALLGGWELNTFRTHRVLSRVGYGEGRASSECVWCVQFLDPDEILGLSYLNSDDALRFAIRMPRTAIVEPDPELPSISSNTILAAEPKGIEYEALYDWMLNQLDYLADRSALLPGPAATYHEIRNIRDRSKAPPADDLGRRLSRLEIPTSLAVQMKELWGDDKAAELLAVALILANAPPDVRRRH